MADNDFVQVQMTRADLDAYQALRAAHAVPGVIGQPMPEAEGDRAFGEPFKANPPAVTRMKSAQASAKKWADNLSAVGEQHYREGIANPKRSWQASAIGGQGAYENKMRDPATLKRRETAIRNVSDDEWAAQAERGAGRLVQGALDRLPKTERKFQAIAQLMGPHLQRIDAMPSDTPAAREQRMVANLRGMRDMKGRV